jgi:Bacterial mobilisation protein (MobC)
VLAELFALRRLSAGMANNVNQIARVANTDGRAPVGTAAALEGIARAVERIDATIDRVAAS